MRENLSVTIPRIPLINIQFPPQFFQFGQSHLAAQLVHFSVHLEYSLSHIQDGFAPARFTPRSFVRRIIAPYTVDVSLRVEPDFASAALRFYKAFTLVQPERLGVNPQDFSRDAYHIAGLLVGVDVGILSAAGSVPVGGHAACLTVPCARDRSSSLTFPPLIIYTL